MTRGMKIRKIAAVAVLVLGSLAASNVAPSKAELEAMYDKAFREFDGNNFSEALKQLDAIDARQPDLAESQNLKKDWAEARTRFQELMSNESSDLQGEAAQLIQYKILLTYLMEGK